MARSNLSVDNEVVNLVASRQATTRAALARELGLAPSTITGVVQRLLAAGLIREGGDTASTGGRPGTNLLPANSNNRALIAEFGAHHARIALADGSGVVHHLTRYELDISDGPEIILRELERRGHEHAEQHGTEVAMLGIALPGPVDPETGTVVGPSRMPGWNGCNVPELVATWSELPVFVENDARIGASGENAFRRIHAGEPGFDDYIFVKADSAIGGAFVENGVVRRGAHGLAGDITHVPMAAGGNRPCQCGNTGCLDTIASARALRHDLQGRGVPVTDNSSLIAAALDGNAEVVTAIRTAGVHLGEALARNVSFLAPHAVIIGGALSTIDAFIGGVRQSLHERCLHAVMEHLAVENSLAGSDAALWGLAEATSTYLNSQGA